LIQTINIEKHNNNPGGNKLLIAENRWNLYQLTYYELYWNGSIDKGFIDLFPSGNINV